MVGRENAEEALDQFLDQCLDDLGPIVLEKILQEHAQDMRELQEAQVTADDLEDDTDA
jgi:hypothetical protein